MRCVLNLQRLKTEITPEAVVNMDNQIARRQSGGFGNKVLRLTFPSAIDQAVTQNVLLGNNGKIAKGKTLLNR